jgi:hypothetical protein
MSKGVGIQGGTASSNDPNITNAMDVLTQRVPGTKEVFFKDNDPTKLMWKVKNKNGEVLHEFDADQLKKISQGNGLIRTVPNQTAEFDKLKSTNSSVFEVVPPKPGEKGDPLPTGKVTPDYLVKDPNTGKPLVKAVTVVNSNGLKITKFEQDVNIDAIKSDANFQSTITSQATGLLANQSSAIDFYNDVISKEQGRWKGTGIAFDPDKPLDDEGKKKFIEDYKEYFVNTQIIPTQAVEKPNADEVTLIEKESKSSKAKGTTTIGGKPTASEKSQASLNSQINDAVKYGGTVKGKNGLYLKIKDKKATVYKLDADGFETPITVPGSNLNDMIVQIGGTLSKKAKLKG